MKQIMQSALALATACARDEKRFHCVVERRSLWLPVLLSGCALAAGCSGAHEWQAHEEAGEEASATELTELGQLRQALEPCPDVDEVPPVWTSFPNDATFFTCDLSEIELTDVPTAEDECGEPPLVISNDMPEPFPSFGGLVVRWRAIDGAGNFVESAQYVIAVPGEEGDAKPEFTYVPPDIVTNDCEDLDTGLATAIDACGGSTPYVFSDRPETFPAGTTTVTWTAISPGGIPDQESITQTAIQTVTCEEEEPEPCAEVTLEAEEMAHSTGGATSDGWNIWSNGNISTEHTFAGGPTSLTVRARGEAANGVFPHMVVSVGGVTVGDVTVNSTAYADYTFTFVAAAGPQVLRIAFDNDLYQPPADRNLIVDSATVGCAAEGDLAGELTVFTDWGSGYCMGLQLTNDGNEPTSSWQAVVDFQNTTVRDLWGASASGTTGQVTLDSLAWNSVLNPGASNGSVGFCANRPMGGSAVATLVDVTGF